MATIHSLFKQSPNNYYQYRLNPVTYGYDIRVKGFTVKNVKIVDIKNEYATLEETFKQAFELITALVDSGVNGNGFSLSALKYYTEALAKINSAFKLMKIREILED